MLKPSQLGGTYIQRAYIRDDNCVTCFGDLYSGGSYIQGLLTGFYSITN